MGGDSLRYHHHSIDLSDRNSAHTQLILLAGRNKRVLEVGPATGYITRVLQERRCEVTGIEKDPIAAQVASGFSDCMIVGDVEALDFADALAGQRFDVVLFGDVLEHLANPQEVLLKAAGVLQPRGYVVASIPNIAHGSVRLTLLGGDFRYTDLGLLDRTHLRFFTAETLERMFREAGYTIRVWRRILMDPFATELHLSAAEYPASIAASLRKDVDAMTYQFVVRAHPVSRPRRSTRKTVSSAREPAAVLHTLRELEGVVQTLRELEAEAQQLQARLVEKELVLQRLQASLFEKELALQHSVQQLNAVCQEASHRVLERIRRLLGRVAPPGTLRGRIHAALLDGLAFLADHGFIASFLRLLQVWRWAPRFLRGRSRGLPPESLSAGDLAGEAELILVRRELVPERAAAE